MTRTSILALLAASAFALSACGEEKTKAEQKEDEPKVAMSDKAPEKIEEPAVKEEEKMDMTGEGPIKAKSGMIVYEVSGVQTGTVTRYWRKHGLEMAEYSEVTTSFGGIERSENNWVITHPDTIYTVDVAANTGTKIDNAGSQLFKGMNEEGFSEDFLTQMGGQKVGQETVAGKSCDLWDVSQWSAKVCIWEGIDIAMTGGFGGMNVTRTATKIDAPSNVDAKHFTPPSDITFADHGSPMDMMKSMPNTHTGDGGNVTMDNEQIQEQIKKAQELMKQMQQGQPQQ